MAIWTAITLPEDIRVMFKDAQSVAYVLPDGSELPVVVEPVWCGRCDRLVNGERIETADVLDRMAAARRQPRSIHYDPIVGADPATDSRQLAAAWGKDLRLLNHYAPGPDLDRRRAWLSARRSPPRCLQCGSTDIVAFPYSAMTMPEMPHPRGFGRLRLDAPCLGDYWGDRHSRLTPEGEAIRTRVPRPKRRWFSQLWQGGPAGPFSRAAVGRRPRGGLSRRRCARC